MKNKALEAPFFGRQDELNELKSFLSKRSASLVVMRGRRRIGKSRLIETFAKGHRFYVISGVYPRDKTTAQSERDEFASQLHLQTGLPLVSATDWNMLFVLLAEKLKRGKIILLFDEISWMATKDDHFLGKLKNAWDIYFKKNPQLIFILCGSVSSWIEENIISSTGFLGRPTRVMAIPELPLSECNKFWSKPGISAFEKFKILSLTGGVPRYLELIDTDLSAEENIRKLCFVPNGQLVNEFQHIFTDIFGKRSKLYQSIVFCLINGGMTAEQLAEGVGRNATGTFFKYLNQLVLSGFVEKDHTWHLKTGKVSKLNHYRLKDNYVRFYLKYILPNDEVIEKGHFKNRTLTSLPGIDTIFGLAFENLVVGNYPLLMTLLGVRSEDIVFANPYFQRKTTRQAGCQIDYMIQTRFDCVYVCEIKFSRTPVLPDVIDSVKEKIQRLKLPRHMSYRPVLIHVNGAHEKVVAADYFTKIIDFSQFLEAVSF